MTGAKNTPPHATLRKQPPSAVSSHFTVRVKRHTPAIVRVVVPVRVESLATKRNRIRRQVSEAFRENVQKNGISAVIAVTVRRSDIPQGAELRRAAFELLRESGMIQQR